MDRRETSYFAAGILFGMGCNVEKIVSIAPDLKIKTPCSIDASLPDIVSLVVFFGS
jgi:hypothetical protein